MALTSEAWPLEPPGTSKICTGADMQGIPCNIACVGWPQSCLVKDLIRNKTKRRKKKHVPQENTLQEYFKTRTVACFNVDLYRSQILNTGYMSFWI